DPAGEAHAAGRALAGEGLERFAVLAVAGDDELGVAWERRNCLDDGAHALDAVVQAAEEQRPRPGRVQAGTRGGGGPVLGPEGVGVDRREQHGHALARYAEARG